MDDQLAWLRCLRGAAPPPSYNREDHKRDRRCEHGDEHVIELCNEGGQTKSAEQGRQAPVLRNTTTTALRPPRPSRSAWHSGPWSAGRRSRLGLLKRGENRASLDGPCFVDTVRN